MICFFSPAIHSKAGQESSAALSLGRAIEPATDSSSSVEGLCRTFYVDSTEDAPVSADLDQVLSTPDALVVPGSEVDSQAVASAAEQASSACSDKSYGKPSNTNKPPKRKQKDLDDLMMTTLTANRERLNELAAAATSVDEDEYFLLSLKGLLGKLDARKKEHIKLQIHTLLVEAAYPPNATDP